MSGDAKRKPEAGAPADDQDLLGTEGDVTGEEAERLAAEAERWLDAEEKSAAKDETSGADETGAAKTRDEDEDEAPLDEVEVRELLRRALRPPPGAVAPSLLGGVQKKLRTRSRGKFYGDGWSTSRSPRSTYLVTSVLMLVLVAFVFLVLLPWGGAALP
ncbi:hypothetical protein [Polyangium jinanense]|uniref:Uncharacterized protein n=1 Tax=Polyangium jinanense TaxID=2829994 RepID=A0A9X4ARW2_9BACT|nr:hypothetical protein [Polyangium jinanense]MDC3979855.1 hypothetical protein [Polyangium jinanense]MDC3982508.1 hypothetical protein [Polyangium jinanense]